MFIFVFKLIFFKFTSFTRQMQSFFFLFIQLFVGKPISPWFLLTVFLAGNKAIFINIFISNGRSKFLSIFDVFPQNLSYLEGLPIFLMMDFCDQIDGESLWFYFHTYFGIGHFSSIYLIYSTNIILYRFSIEILVCQYVPPQIFFKKNYRFFVFCF